MTHGEWIDDGGLLDQVEIEYWLPPRSGRGIPPPTKTPRCSNMPPSCWSGSRSKARAISIVWSRPAPEVVYNNNRRAILALEKDTPGERVFADAFKAWKQ